MILILQLVPQIHKHIIDEFRDSGADYIFMRATNEVTIKNVVRIQEYNNATFRVIYLGSHGAHMINIDRGNVMLFEVNL